LLLLLFILVAVVPVLVAFFSMFVLVCVLVLNYFVVRAGSDA
jgi:hypothetical protein